MVSASQAGADGPSTSDIRGTGNGAVENGHALKANEDKEWRGGSKEEDWPSTHSAPPGLDEHKQQQGRVIRWEKFLPVETLRVLLVENDDCTRHVVRALLRKCGYEVIAAENGLHAWHYLEDVQNRIDLVLTEVAMPCLSGIGLLSKITSHSICKGIPVIMMSKNDSMSTVFKCLSKGAVDFLVKPIRKNELKTLWQHIWRRCHSSSGSESGIHTQKCSKPKAGDEYENNSGGSHDDDDDDDDDADDDFSVGPNARDGSDNGSGTQSSWTKRAVEIDSPQLVSSDHLADSPDSTCAQVIHPRSEIGSNRWLPTANKRNINNQKENNDDSMGKYLEIGAPRNSSLGHQSSPNQMSVNPTEKQHENLISQNKSVNKIVIDEPTSQTADLISSIARNTESKQAARITDAPDCSSKMAHGTEMKNDSPINMPSQELGLKISETARCGTEIHDERSILKRSNLSAFTRYHTPMASDQGGATFRGSCSPQDNSSEAVKTNSTCKMESNSDAAQIKQGSNGSSNNNDMGSSTKNAIAKPCTDRERVMSPSLVKSNQQTSAFHPVQHQVSPADAARKDKASEEIVNAVKVGHSSEAQQSSVQHHHHAHYYRHVIAQQQTLIDRASNARCGSSNASDLPLEGHAANYGVNGSISGSNNGSNTQNASSSAPNIARPNMDSGAMDKTEAGGGNGSGSGPSGSGNDMVCQNQLSQREAAVNKFRQKRKERNFGKKVRYQSRKRLAEQRPRVRGQFVRQSGQEDEAGQAEDR
ncbi:two-component response regulator-like PRR73 [Triticum dicoccoides]|uniref:two-component response regulator-like PRR73 n=1 Tax=Triticum dicoccoides TaxID=85692 RepID=UPI000E793F12|nr:two-component response regulator-like PRR73 [Triticum dicoccoides]